MRKNYFGGFSNIMLFENSRGEFCASIISENRSLFVSLVTEIRLGIPFGSPHQISGARPSRGRSDRQVVGVDEV